MVERVLDGVAHIIGDRAANDGGPALASKEAKNCGVLVQKGVNPPNYVSPRAGEEFVRTISAPTPPRTTA